MCSFVQVLLDRLVDGHDFPLAMDLAVLAGFTLAALIIASWRFSQESAYEPMIHILTGKRGD